MSRVLFSSFGVIALLAGFAGAIAFDQLRGEAGAAPQSPADQKVREQNLDGTGLIRVHEQGTANVNVINGPLPVSGSVTVGNLPAVQDVNVLSLPQDPGPFEFKSVHAHLCVSETELCLQGSTDPATWSTKMALLSAQGWSLVETKPVLFSNTDILVFILRRPA